MNYADKLKQFNSTEKYRMEMEFLSRIVGDHTADEYILDYGCGLGFAMAYIKLGTNATVMGYDVTEFIPGFKYANPKAEEFQTVFFMHSLAHIPNIKQVLEDLMTESVAVITPNAEWLDRNKNDMYKPDPTVVKHFTQASLLDLFESAGYKIILNGQFGECVDGHNERLFLSASKIRQ